jgi:hypothetical protein
MSRFATTHRIALLLVLLSAAFPQPDHAAQQPDITSKKGIIFGGAPVGGAGGKVVPWGGSVQLTEANAVTQSGGKCAFNISYDLVNNGPVATGSPFQNYLRTNQAIATTQSALALKANEVRVISTQAYLPAGQFPLNLVMDTTSQVAESNEGNNAAKVTVTVGGKCK